MSSPSANPSDGVAMVTNSMTGEPSTQPPQDGPSLSTNEAEAPTNETNNADAGCNSGENSVPGNLQLDSQKPKRAKRKGKSAAARGPGALNKSCGTGFEEFYCDPPRTPAEALEEQTDIYPPHRPFVDRIEECLQRFRARRRLDSERTNLFNKFLAIGGIDGSPRQFQGGDSIDLEGATTGEARESMASDVIHRTGNDSRYYNPKSPEHWDVDFAGVVSGFFSERIFKLVGSDTRLIKMAVDVVQNFLNYVLFHDVCPEYATNLREAKAVCDQSIDQISRIYGIWPDVPGDFGVAAQTLYCRDYEQDSTAGYYDGPVMTMESRRAKIVFMATVATMDGEAFNAFNEARISNTVEIVDTVEQAFEILELREPSEDVVEMYRGVKDPATGGAPGTIDPCGIVVLEPITIQDGWDIGLAPSPSPSIKTRENIVFNCCVMRHLLVGMKVRLVLCTLNTGIKFIKEFKEVYPTYYTFLPQELMLAYKEPVPSERPAPSAEDLDAEEEQQNKMEKE